MPARTPRLARRPSGRRSAAGRPPRAPAPRTRSRRALAVHQMGGFDSAAVRARFGLGDTLTPVVALAIGRCDGTAELPEPFAARETAPRTRRPVSDLLLTAHAEARLAAA
jgi:hypothetical protein